MLRLTYTVAGDTQLDRALGRYGDALKDMSPAFKDIAESLKKAEVQQFASQGGAGGGWAPLSDGYALWKQINYPGKPILELTGALKASVTGSGPHYVEQITKDSLKVGTSLFYALFHQRGTGRMPARPVIQLTEENKRGWMKILQVYAYKAAREAGLL